MNFSFLGELHPVFAYIPIFLFPIAFISYLLNSLIKEAKLQIFAPLILMLATLSAIIAMVMGLVAEIPIGKNLILHDTLRIHKIIGICIASLGALLSFWSFVDRKPRSFLLMGFIGMLALISLAVIFNGYLGLHMM